MSNEQRELSALDRDFERLTGEAAQIDPYRYRRRRRFVYAVFLGAGLAGIGYLALKMFEEQRNPCQRLHDYLCAEAARTRDPKAALQCETYRGVLTESIEDESPRMRSTIRAQCATKIARLAAEDGVTVP